MFVAGPSIRPICRKSERFTVHEDCLILGKCPEMGQFHNVTHCGSRRSIQQRCSWYFRPETLLLNCLIDGGAYGSTAYRLPNDKYE